ncbi:hypothetical protein BCR44DRAFT_1276437 [Catenaria anguillulae PL171]|uniref:Uncharacterized protein n=1 Tax=Catenaria anguillulae PL171 TaxID=765915 RepID=A0A1Y2H9J7_9FUNG|nr:hypothetical protein BCR44DRAFT_1276437 [Catenaria anguillulae PL171]
MSWSIVLFWMRHGWPALILTFSFHTFNLDCFFPNQLWPESGVLLLPNVHARLSSFYFGFKARILGTTGGCGQVRLKGHLSTWKRLRCGAIRLQDALFFCVARTRMIK